MYGNEESLYVKQDIKIETALIPVVKMPITGNLRTGISYPIKVTTKVVDQDNNPLEGVHLYLKSNPSSKGAVTNFDGFVSLQGVEFDDILEFSYLGTKFEKMAGSILGTTKLKIDGWDLEGVVLTAPPKKEYKNTWLWWLGTAVVIGTYYAYKNSQKKKYIKAKL